MGSKMACITETPTIMTTPTTNEEGVEPVTKPHSPSTLPDSEDDDDESMTCMVCWEQTANDSTTTPATTTTATTAATSSSKTLLTLPCNHGACHSCITNWIERCEGNGHDEATCPHCRQEIHPDAIAEIMGRPYERVSQKLTPEDAAIVDDFTQTWLDDNEARECSNCGMWSVREGDDSLQATACLCGYIYCWNCEDEAEDCGCDHHEYYDYLTDDCYQMSDASDYPVATEEDLQDFQAFMQRRKAVICGDDENEADSDEEQEKQKVQEEPAEYVFLVSVFDECTEPAEYVFLASIFDECTEAADYVFVVSIFDECTEPAEYVFFEPIFDTGKEAAEDVFLVPLFGEYTGTTAAGMPGFFDFDFLL
ncbi:expressed unknown protein [Seminavis robusta]|uniref:RING-type domain-containing protein n=1 Tax=Seminavis robusta TaxID=568900 RepID=A0A9N8E3D9_9STRA|nr:expressed unknown protein [Seminavis robusta]|eukprot:Sro618_g176270.1 n/a (366) ;mRNA; f:32450-33547